MKHAVLPEHGVLTHEGSGPDFNAILSLGLVRTLFKNLIPMSQALAVDADKRAKWQDIIDRMSAYPTQDREGKSVFRYTEKGMAWNDGNTLGIQHIYPAGTTRPASRAVTYSTATAVRTSVVAKVGSGGAVEVYLPAGGVHVVVDVAGYVTS